MDQSPAIQIQGLIKSYGRVRALRGVDLEVQRGEIFGSIRWRCGRVSATCRAKCSWTPT
jgi:ABC-type uncharacterized transport system ATPase subunit